MTLADAIREIKRLFAEKGWPTGAITLAHDEIEAAKADGMIGDDLEPLLFPQYAIVDDFGVYRFEFDGGVIYRSTSDGTPISAIAVRHPEYGQMFGERRLYPFEADEDGDAKQD